MEPSRFAIINVIESIYALDWQIFWHAHIIILCELEDFVLKYRCAFTLYCVQSVNFATQSMLLKALILCTL